jgi:hypothetical protein
MNINFVSSQLAQRMPARAALSAAPAAAGDATSAAACGNLVAKVVPRRRAEVPALQAHAARRRPDGRSASTRRVTSARRESRLTDVFF